MSGIKKSMANIFVIVGGSHSGKDEIIRAIQDLGGLHAQIIPKFTSRLQQEDDEKEIKCNYAFKQDKDSNYLVQSRESGESYKCDIVYKKNGNEYGIDTHQIWAGLRKQKFQVIVVSEVEAINRLIEKFGSLVVLIYVHSAEEAHNLPEFRLFVENFNEFDHVLIAEDRKEDLYDQLFRLFRAYE